MMRKKKQVSSGCLLFLQLPLLLLLYNENTVTFVHGQGDLCSQLSDRTKLTDLSLQSFTYLQYEDRNVYLLSQEQLFIFSLDGLSSSKPNLLKRGKQSGTRLWEEDPLLAYVKLGNKQLEYDRTQINMVTVLMYDWETKIKFFLPRVWYEYSYYGVVRTTAKMHVIQAIGEAPDTEFELGDPAFYEPDKYPQPFHFVARFPGDDVSSHRAFVFQMDDFYNSGSPVMYKLNFDDRKPEVARPQTKGAFNMYYLVAGKDNPSQVNLVGTEKEGAKQEVTEAPLLHRVPIGFETDQMVLYLVEPEIWCVYAIEGLDLKAHEKPFKLTRRPLESFFTCGGGGSDSTSGGTDLFPADRCDSVEASKKFFENKGAETTPPPSNFTYPPMNETGNGTGSGFTVFPIKQNVKKTSFFLQLWVGITGLILVLLVIVLMVVWVVRTARSGGGGHGRHHGGGAKTVRRQVQGGTQLGPQATSPPTPQPTSPSLPRNTFGFTRFPTATATAPYGPTGTRTGTHATGTGTSHGTGTHGTPTGTSYGTTNRTGTRTGTHTTTGTGTRTGTGTSHGTTTHTTGTTHTGTTTTGTGTSHGTRTTGTTGTTTRTHGHHTR